jgi:hypothetical protein
LIAKSWADCEKDHLPVEPKVDLLATMVLDQTIEANIEIDKKSARVLKTSYRKNRRKNKKNLYKH